MPCFCVRQRLSSHNQFVSHTGLVMYHLPCSLTTSHPMTNSLWVKWPYCLPASLISWQIGSEWLNPFFLLSQASYDSYPMTNSKWVTQPCFMPGSLITSWPTVCEWHSPIFWPCSLIISHCQQFVSDRHYPVFLPHLIQWPTESECQGCPHFRHVVTSHDNSLWENCFFSSRLSLQISSHDQQEVSNTVLFYLCQSLIAPHPMMNRKWVTLPPFLSWSLITFHLPTQFVSDATLLFCHATSWVLSHDQQVVSATAIFLPHHTSSMTNRLWGHLPLSAKQFIKPSVLTNRKWVTLRPLFLPGNLMPWPTASECHCLFSA